MYGVIIIYLILNISQYDAWLQVTYQIELTTTSSYAFCEAVANTIWNNPRGISIYYVRRDVFHKVVSGTSIDMWVGIGAINLGYLLLNSSHSYIIRKGEDYFSCAEINVTALS